MTSSSSQSLRLRELEHFEKLAEASTGSLPGAVPATGTPPGSDPHRQALARLVDHLDDHLVEVDRSRASGDRGTPAALAVFRARNGPRSLLYVIVTQPGHILLGHANDLSRVPVASQLSQYDPMWHEILSVSVTARFLGNKSDLWILVRQLSPNQDEKPCTVAYHGLVGATDDGRLMLEPSSDNWHPEPEPSKTATSRRSSPQWRPHPSGKLPKQIRSWRVSCSPLTEPFGLIPERVMRFLNWQENNQNDHLKLVVRGRHHLATLTGDEVNIVPLAKNTRMAMSLERSTPDLKPLIRLRMQRRGKLGGKNHRYRPGGHVRAVALYDPDPNDAIGIASCEDHYLFGFAQTGNTWTTSWAHPCTKLPVALEFLPDEERKTWPDLLAVLHDGSLKRFRRIEKGRLQAVWERLWRALGFETMNTLPHPRRSFFRGAEPAVRKAALHAEIEEVLAHLTDADEERLDHDLTALSDWFHPSENHTVLRDGMARLLEAFRDSKRRALGHLASRNETFLTVLIQDIYNRSHLSLRNSIDRMVRNTEFNREERERPAIRFLRRMAVQSKGELFHETRAPQSIDDTIYRAGLGIESWANPLVMGDTQRIWQVDHLAQTGVAGSLIDATSPEEKPSGWVASADRRQIRIFHLKDARLIHRGNVQFIRFKTDRIRDMERLPGPRADRLLVLTHSGALILYRVDQDGAGVEERDRVTFESAGNPRTLAVCSFGVDDQLAAVAFVEKGRSRVGFVRIRGYGLAPPVTHHLDLMRISHLDLSIHEERPCLIAATEYGGPIHCYRANTECTELVHHQWFHIMRQGATAISFDEGRDPRFILAGDREGMLWCMRMDASRQTQKLIWTHRVDHVVHDIERVFHDKRPHFLVGTENCDALLFEAETGRRVWSRKLPSPVRRISRMHDDREVLVLGLHSGWISLFSDDPHRHATLDRVRSLFENLEEVDPGILQEKWEARDTGSVRGIFMVENEGKSYPEALASLDTQPLARQRLLRHLVQTKAKPTIDPPAELHDPLANSANFCEDHLARTLAILDFRELYLILSYLPAQWHAWDEPIWRALKQRDPDPEDEGEGPYATRAVVSFLQRRAERDLTPALLAELYPHLDRHDDSWVKLEVARVLLVLIEKRRSPTEPEPFVGDLIAHLVDFDPELVPHLEAVIPFQSPLLGYLQSLTRLVKGLDASQGGFSQADLNQISDVIRAVNRDPRPSLLSKPLLQLLSALADWFQIVRKSQNGAWARWRKKVLNAMRALSEAVGHLQAADPPLDILLTGIRNLLGEEPVPKDQEPLEQRHAWLERLRKRSYGQWRSGRPQRHPWAPLLERLVSLFQDYLDYFIHMETESVLATVRPHLELIGQDGDRSQIRLSLRAVPEGFRVLRDVTLTFDVDHGASGLGEPGQLVHQQDVLHYPDTFSTFDFGLHGLRAEDQASVTIIARLEAGNGYRHKEAWEFPIKTESPGAGFTLWQWAPDLLGDFLKQISQYRKGAGLIAFDAELGVDRLISAWIDQNKSRYLDLDGFLADYGPGRRYDATQLHPELIVDRLKCELGDLGPVSHASRPGIKGLSPLLLGPSHQLEERLAAGEAPEFLENWLQFLREWSANGRKPALLWLVSSRLANKCRGLGLGPLRRHAAHLFVKQRLSALAGNANLNELLDKIGAITGQDRAQCAARCAELGWDPRFILSWLNGVRIQPDRASIPTTQIHEQRAIRDWIHSDLACLQPMETIFTLFGARANSVLAFHDVEEGHVAAQDYLSHPRQKANRPKILQEKGRRFSRESLRKLKSDGRANKLRIEGFGTRGTVEENDSGLRGLAMTQNRARKKDLFQVLKRNGLGTEIGGIFRTGAPYRSIILELYARFADVPPHERDTQVYQNLLGSGRFPLENMTMSDLSRNAPEQLHDMVPHARLDDLKKLHRLTTLWGDEVEDEQRDHLLHSLFGAVRVINGHARGHWYAPLGHLPIPVFAVVEAPRGTPKHPAWFLAWVPKGRAPQFNLLHDHLDSAAKARWAEEDQGANPPDTPGDDLENSSTIEPIRDDSPHQAVPIRMALLGPGLPPKAFDQQYRVAVLQPRDLIRAVYSGDLLKGMHTRIRAQMRLTALSPFQTSGALPPGSPLFKGREQELDFIFSRIRKVSILIVGSRRVGKTSLLNRVWFWATRQSDLLPIYLDLQGIRDRHGFEETLRDALRHDTREEVRAMADRDVRELVQAARANGRTVLFCLNEIDGLVHYDRDYLETWRGLNEREGTRFLMVGYSAISHLGDPRSSFFHWTEGLDFEGKAIALTSLSPQGAKGILDLLVTSDLPLTWRAEEEREAAHKLCMARGYRIPWVLQRFGQLIVEHMERARRTELTYDDVAMILDHEGQVVWQYIDSINYNSIAHEEHLLGHSAGFKLILYSLARVRYFLGGPNAPIRDPNLHKRTPFGRDLGFTVGEARQNILASMERLLIGREYALLARWVERLDLAKVLRLLTLTLMLEPDPKVKDRYGFMLHILPLELQQKYGQSDPTLDSLIVEHSIEFLNLLRNGPQRH